MQWWAWLVLGAVLLGVEMFVSMRSFISSSWAFQLRSSVCSEWSASSCLNGPNGSHSRCSPSCRCLLFASAYISSCVIARAL